MPDLAALLADIGRASVPPLWVPVAVWTVLAAACEASLRLARAHASLAVRARSALLVALPLCLAAPAMLALVPEAAGAVASIRPQRVWLPEIVVGGSPATDLEAVASPVWAALGALTVLAGAWGLTGLARWLLALTRLRGVRATLGPAPTSVQDALEATRRSLGVRTTVTAAQCAPGAAPFTFGWPRPVVAVPPGLDGEALRLALAHELAHVRHRDFEWNVVEQAIGACGSPHPLVSVLARQIALGREQAADAAVLAAHPHQRRAYADLLLSYASLPAPRLSLGAVGGSSFLQTRILAMNHPSSPTHLRRLATAGRALSLALVAALVGSAAALAGPPDIDIPALSALPAETVEGRSAQAQLASGPTSALQIVPPSADTPASTRADLTPGLDDRPVAERDTVHEVVDVAPRLIGGLQGLQARVVYPTEAKEQGISGRVFVMFVVDEQGQTTDLEVARSPDPVLSEAALAAVRTSSFTPAEHEGQAVRVRYTIPINFALPGSSPEPNRSPDRTSDAQLREDGILYGGVDLSLLENERHIRAMMASLGQRFKEEGLEATEFEFAYTLQPNGKASDIRVTKASGEESMRPVVAGFILGMMTLREDRRPRTPREGVFRFAYTAP